jgi:hypothetical protein
MVTRGIRAFVSRDWAEARRAKDAYWADRIARVGPAEGVRIADELRRQAQRLNPAWPSEQDRDEDLRAHVRLAERFRHAAAIRRR